MTDWLNRGGLARALPYAALCAAIAAIVLLLVGCGAGALSAHARAATVTASTLAAAGDVVDVARDRALDRVEEAYPTDPEHDAQLRLEIARWEPLGAALDTARAAVLLWVRSIQTAHLSGDDAGLLAVLLPIAARVVLVYGEAARLATALGAPLPELPADVALLAQSVGGGL